MQSLTKYIAGLLLITVFFNKNFVLHLYIYKIVQIHIKNVCIFFTDGRIQKSHSH